MGLKADDAYGIWGDKVKKFAIGYTQGVYDMFHIGHLNLLNHAKMQCGKLIVGVNSDELVMKYKNKKTVIPEAERLEIIKNIKAVDEAMLVTTLDKIKLFGDLGFDAVFIGDDWKGTDRWKKTEEELERYGVKTIYLPYTKNISSTILRLEQENVVDER